MKVYLTRRYMISASHRLHAAALSESENAAIYGKCNNPHGHGHNYALEVTVSGQVDPQTGMVCDLGALDGTVRRSVLDRFDHQNLNERQEFRGLVPTTENLAAIAFDLLRDSELFRQGTPDAESGSPPSEILQRKREIPHLERVRIEETSKNSFEYSGEQETHH